MRKTPIALALALATVVLTLPAEAAPAAQTVRVNEVDYRIVLGSKPRAGKVTFVIRNGGDHDHDFWLRGAGVNKKTPLLEPGQSARLTVTLKRGKLYKIWCAPHAGRGMRTSFTAG
jgi:uncharacterized cupredoxin-like copper-binding protein